MQCRLLISHTLTVWSELLETNCWLSGEKATLRTHEACPDKVPATFACFLQHVTHHICTNKKDLQLSCFQSLSMKASSYESVERIPYNTLQKTEGPSQPYYQNIQCLCRGYSPVSTLCITNTKNELAPK